MSKPWGGIGAWADEAERADEEQASHSQPRTDVQSFPSLKEAAATTKPSKKNKKMTLSEFTQRASYTREQMPLQLPTGPRQRSDDEMQQHGGRIGGGFSSYGGRRRDDGGEGGGGGDGSRRGYGGGFDDDQRGGPRMSDFPQPSRADEADDWGKMKKPLQTFDQGRQTRGSSGGGYSGFSKADGVDNWGAGKTQSSFTKSATFGSGGVQEERRRLVLEPRKVVVVVETGVETVVKTNKPNPFGAARPREEVLAEKGLDWKKVDLDIEAKKETSSAHSSRPSSAHSNRSESSENVVKPRVKVNPFGDAKPREVLLEEQGKDWRKIDSELEHRRVDRAETEGERVLKEEIEELRTKEPQLPDVIQEKEKELELLIRDLDDKVRFRPRGVERPGSGAGRTVGSYSERPRSRGGSVDESRSGGEFMERPRSRGMGGEFMERPRSRGMGGGDPWSRPGGDDRRNFQGGSKERGFFSNRNFDRSSSARDGW